MTGLPAARQTDATLYGGPIVQGSLTVLIGSSGGVACSVCPGGVTEGNPINPILGAKVQSAEVDLQLPGPLSFLVSRNYSSYQTAAPAPVGLLGPGWWLPHEMSLLQTPEQLSLADGKGRSIAFDALAPGETAFSPSEGIWLVRGGHEQLPTWSDPAQRLEAAWLALDAGLRRCADHVFLANDPLGPWWIFAPAAALGGGVAATRLMLSGMADRFGRTQTIERNPQTGHIERVKDGSQREFRLEYVDMRHLADDGRQGWGPDPGLRLAAIHLVSHHRSGESGAVSAPSVPLVRYEYSARGELAAVYGRDARLRRSFRYHPQQRGRMVAQTHAGRPETSYVYDAAGRVVEQHRAGTLEQALSYDERSTTVVDQLGRKRVYHFEGQGGLRRVVRLEQRDGTSLHSRFDANGRLVASIDAAGRETRYDIDVVTGDVLSMTLSDGELIRTDYDARGLEIRRHSSRGTVTSMEYDALGRLGASTDVLGHTTRYHYKDASSENPTSVEDPKGGRVHYEWNSSQQLIRRTDCSGSQTRYFYDAFGQLIRTEGEEGTFDAYELDGQGRVCVHTNAAHQITRYRFSEAGDLLEIGSPDGSFARFDYDEHGRLLAQHEGGSTQAFQYDAVGRISHLINENGARASLEYDVMDRRISQTGFDGRTQRFSYDASGHLVESDDAGLRTRYEYDSDGRLVTRHVLDPRKGTEFVLMETLRYSESGHLGEVRQATEFHGITTAMQLDRDPLGRVLKERQIIASATGETLWQYQVEHDYDALGSETQTRYEGLPPVLWQTYGAGHLHGVMLDGATLVDFERDKLHRETERRFAGTTIASSYDALSQLQHVQVRGAWANEDVSVDYPSLRRALAQAIDRQHEYDAMGQLTAIHTAQGSRRYAYDKAGRIARMSHPHFGNIDYRFDAAGNQLRAGLQASAETTPWEEVALQRFQDRNFNLLGDAKSPTHASNHRQWTSNRILVDDDYRYGYDTWGNVVHKQRISGNEQHHYVYDCFHRLIRYEFESDACTRGANYFYDPAGRRVAKQTLQADAQGNLTGEGVITTYFGWDGDRLVRTQTDDQCIHTLYEPARHVPLIRIESSPTAPLQTLAHFIEEQSGAQLDATQHAKLAQVEKNLRSGKATRESDVWLQHARIDPGALSRWLLAGDGKNADRSTERTLHLYHCDHLGTPEALINESAQVSWSIELDPFGATLGEHNPENLHQSIRFQGQQWDEESGLHYNRHRFYDTHLARYITQDPLGFMGGIHMYAYAGNNPLRNIDPLGLREAFAKYGPPAPEVNTVVCDGNGGMKVQVSARQAAVKDAATCGVINCIEVHEKQHVQDLNTLYKNTGELCKGIPANAQIGFANACLRYISEIKAYDAGLACLKKLKNKACQDLVQEAIRISEISLSNSKHLAKDFCKPF
ncbi:RHS repeat-associated core domain-containing protein [Diaphorobacter caeni]|uniref:RHS repeat-associated core domain-containing protein n=1 Tax=Diaphorobacter caeni TaxID=2784387 RepID=UPI00188EAC39|nr:RHS repeat-associated core domain-containing protein [Diaphorobacter caeni]MBF5005255.1 RHS repeat protein [Diaphorobacter caeni]